MATTSPVGYDEQGNPIETVTVVATPLIDWPKLLLLAASFIAIVKLASDKRSKLFDFF